jgi:hypothetical protein
MVGRLAAVGTLAGVTPAGAVGGDAPAGCTKATLAGVSSNVLRVWLR